MPTYEYECTSCRQRVEVFQRLSEDPLTTCQRCGGSLRKLFHPIGIAFRGSGFYTTDSRSTNGAKAKKDKDPSSSKDTSSKDTSSGSKDTPSGSTKKDASEKSA